MDFSQSVAKSRWQQFLKQRQNNSSSHKANGNGTNGQIATVGGGRKLASALSDDEVEPEPSSKPPPRQNRPTTESVKDKSRRGKSRSRERNSSKSFNGHSKLSVDKGEKVQRSKNYENSSTSERSSKHSRDYERSHKSKHEAGLELSVEN